ncbi:MAG: metal-dependent hydrolase, partial [Porphyrobacter sp.]|nr:metal-dependent hydrolase [Porphyrobacter sp.]
MDNVTHSLVGWTLGQTGLKRKSRKGLAALILGANAPDIDVFLGWVPWAPLATHRGWTHSLVGGVLVLPPLLAGLLWLLDRWQVRRGRTFKSGLEMHFGWLVALSYIGCLTHPFLDWQTSYAIQLFSPFSNRWYHNDSLVILDVWIWLGLGFAIWLSRRRERSGQGDWRRPAIVAGSALLAYIGANGALTAHAYKVPLESA